MSDFKINSNTSSDGDDEAARIEKKRQAEEQNQATAAKRADAFKNSMQKSPNGAASAYAAQDQSKETPKAAKPATQPVDPAAQAEEPDGGPDSKPTLGVFKRESGSAGIASKLSAPADGATGNAARAMGNSGSAGSATSSANSASAGSAGDVSSPGLGSSSGAGSAESSSASADASTRAGQGDAGSENRDGSSGDDANQAGEIKSRIDIAAITPSFPAPTTQGHAPVAATPPPAGVNMQMIEQMLQFAAVGKTKEGLSEFHLGIGAGPLAGMNICLTSMGRRRVKLRFSGVVDADAINDAQVNQLVGALQSRNVEVVEVEIA